MKVHAKLCTKCKQALVEINEQAIWAPEDSIDSPFHLPHWFAQEDIPEDMISEYIIDER